MPQDPISLPGTEDTGSGEAFLQSVLGSAEDCMKILDLDGRILWMSENGRKILEVSDFSKVKNLPWLDFLRDPSALEGMQKALEEGRNGNPGRFQGFCATMEGTPKWWDVTITPIFGPDGKPQRLFSVSRDITKTFQSEQELEQIRLRLDATLAYADIGTWTWDIPSNVVSADKNLARMFSIPGGKGPVENFVQAIHPDDRQRVGHEIGAVLNSKEGDFETDYRIQSADGSVRWFTARGKVQFDSHGKPFQFPGVIIDITDRKNQEEAYRDLTQKMETQARIFDATLSNISDLAYTFDHEARVVYANKPLLEIWGVTLEEAVGKNCFELNYPIEIGTRVNTELLQVIATGNPIRGETAFTSAAGVVDYHEYIFNPVFGPYGKVVAVAGTTRLVTQRKRREKIAQEQNDMVALRSEINSALNQGGSIRDILQHCAEILTHRLVQVAVRISTTGPYGEHAELQACSGIENKAVSAAPDEIRLRRILQTRQPFFGSSPADTHAPQKEGDAFFADYPLLSENKIVGMVTLDSHHSFSETTLQEIPHLADAIAQWIRRRESDEEARKSTEQLRLAISAANLGNWQWDPKSDLTTMSDRASEIFGIEPGRLMTRTQLRELVDPEYREQAAAAAQAAMQPGVDYDVEYKVNRPNGTQCWVAAKGRQIFGDDGKMISTLGVVQDITERKREGEANQYLAAIVESSEDAVISKNLNGVITSWNAGAERLFGYGPAEIIGRPVTILIPADKQQEEPRILERIRNGERIDHFETIRLHKNGTLINVSLTVSPIKDSNDRIIGASKIARNITERKKTEAELLRRERLYRAIGDSIDFGIWVCDAEGANTYASPSFLRLVGMTQKECSESGWGRVLHPDQLESTLAAWKKVCKEGTFWEREHLFKGVDGKWHSILARGVPVHDDEGKVVSWVGINLDIQAFKQAEAKLKQAQEKLLEHARELEQRVDERTAELKETNSQLETLVYSIAHDLRAPLRSMQAYSKTLLEDYALSLDETAQHYAKRIVHSSETMDALVLDLLAYGRIARSEMVLEPIPLERVWESALTQYEKDIEEKKAVIDTVLPLPSVLGNEVTLVQVLANLLGNALKFVAPEMTPSIRFRTERDGDMVRIWVEDNGIGIDPEYHERIFRVFERLQGQAYPGTGIGLSIVRKGIERMGGKTGIESTPGNGCRFWIELPASRA